MECFKERNEIIQKKKHEFELNKIQSSELRHSQNVLGVKERYEQKANDNQEKLMKKYVTFYWNRRKKEEQQKNKFLHFNEKYEENIIDWKKLKKKLKKIEKI